MARSSPLTVRRGTLIAALSLGAVVVTSSSTDPGHSAHPGARTPAHALPDFGKLPLHFEPNVGEAPLPTLYLARGVGYDIALTEQGAVFNLDHTASHRAVRLGLGLVGASAKPRLSAERQQQSVSNYFLGNDPSKWHRNIANYAAVRYQQVYPGIDWLVYGNPRQLEYDFVVAPQADPARIRVEIEGADSVSLDNNGDLLIKTQDRPLRQLKPVIYQTAADGTRHAIDGHYVLTDGKFAFALGRYDHSRELIIDPAFVYSTYFSAGALAIAADTEGNAYVVGSAAAMNFPAEQPLQSSDGERIFPTAFISKFNAAGTSLLYSTYLGGTGSDRSGNLGSCGPVSGPNPGGGRPITVINGGDGATAIAVDAQGNAYIAGFTSSSDFPTVGPLQATNRAAASHGSNAFLAKLNAAGNALVYSTYLGGSGDQAQLITGDSALAIALDAAGEAYIAGITESTDFPTQMAFQASNTEPSGTPTAFVAKVNVAGSALVYSSYLGGGGGKPYAGVGDCANAIAVDGSGNAYVAGQTSSANFPTVAAFQPANHSAVENAFVTKLNPGGSPVYSTYLGGSTEDAAFAIAVDASGDAYLAGFTASSDFPTANALQPQNATGGHGANAFVSKFNPIGKGLIYSTYLGGSTYEQANGLAVDESGNAYVTGATYSNNFPTVGPLQATNTAGAHSADNAFISVLNPGGTTLEFSTYLGGSGNGAFISCPAGPADACPKAYDGDSASAIAVDGSGNIYVTGTTSSIDFPTVAAFQNTPAQTFVTKISLGQMPTQSAPVAHGAAPLTHGGGGAFGWGAISTLALGLVTRRRAVAASRI
jgi:hypothetical protein